MNITDMEWYKTRRYPEKFLTHWDYIGHNRQAQLLLGDEWNDTLAQTVSGQAQLIQLGIAKLNKLVFIGISENLIDSMRLFCNTFYINCNITTMQKLLIKQVNVQRVAELTQPMIEYITKRNQIDIQLYNAAKSIFEDRLAKFLKPLPKEMYEAIKNAYKHSNNTSKRFRSNLSIPVPKDK